jgi:hypothetical protein
MKGQDEAASGSQRVRAFNNKITKHANRRCVPDFQRAKSGRMKPASALVLLTAVTLTSCSSNEELQHRLDRRNDSYFKLQERREMRQDARDERYEAWFDRIMD